MDPRRQTKQITLVPGVTLPASALRFRFARSGGPGGQHVNKVSTKATLTVRCEDLAAVLPEWALKRLVEHAGRRFATDPDRIVLSAARSRSQRANRQACLLKLGQMATAAMRRPRRRQSTRPSAAVIQRRLDAKKAHGRLKTQRREGRDPTVD